MKIVAHRGLTQEYNENTLDAIQAASNIGCENIEIDVILSSDNTIFLSHDLYSHRGNDFEKLSDEVLIERHNLSKLSDILHKFEHITFQIDIKSHKVNIIDCLFKLIYVDNNYDNCILTSFNEKHLEDIMKHENKYNINIKKGYITNNTHNDNFQTIINKYKLDIIVIEHSQINEDLFKEIHKMNVKISVYTVNERHIYKLCKKTGVNYIVTDYPKSFLPRFSFKKLKFKK